MPSKTYGVALIGCGHMGEAHIQNIYYKPHVSMEYVCDWNTERATEFQRKYGVKRITADYRECTQSADVDIVIICTYPSTHLEILETCLENGKHVICEKPITANEEDGRRFTALVKAHPQCQVLIGYILRHNKTYQKVADMIHSGAIGSPILFRMVQNHHTMDWKKYLSLIRETSPIIDCGVHYADVMHWFTGAEITGIQAVGLRTEPDVPEDGYNYGLFTARLSDGSIGYYEAGWSNTMSSDNLKEFIGPKGRIRLIYRKDRQTHQEEGDLIEYYKYPEKTYEMINLECSRKPTGDQFDYLIGMIEQGWPAVPSLDEVCSSFEAVCQADRLIRQSLYPGKMEGAYA